MFHQFFINLGFLINTLLISFVLPLIHTSIPGGDSGELLAAISPPRYLIDNVFGCLTTEVQITENFKKNQQQSQDGKKSSSSTCSKTPSTAESSSCERSTKNNLISELSSLRHQKKFGNFGFDDTDGYFCNSCSPPAEVDEELEKESQSCIKMVPFPESVENLFKTIATHWFQSVGVDSGLAHPPGYSLYTTISHFLISVSYEFWRPGAFAVMLQMSRIQNNVSTQDRHYDLYSVLSSSFLPNKSNASSSTSTFEDLLLLSHQEHSETIKFLLFDFVLRAHLTSFVFSMGTVLVIFLSVFRFSFKMFYSNNNINNNNNARLIIFGFALLTSATSSILAILALSSSSTFVRYSTEVEVFSLNYLILALGIWAFLEVQLTDAVDGNFFSFFLASFCLGLIFSHQHAALFVAVPCIFAAVIKLILVIKNRKSFLNALHLVFGSIFAFSCAVMFPLFHMYSRKCIYNQGTEEASTSSFAVYNWVGDNKESCFQSIFSHIVREYYGTFSMTSSSSSTSQDQNLPTSSLTNRFNAHLQWISQPNQTPLSIVALIFATSIQLFFTFYRNRKNFTSSSSPCASRFALTTSFWLLASFCSSIGLFAWFSEFDVAPETSNGLNIFAHVHERFWSQTCVVVSFWCGTNFSAVVSSYISSRNYFISSGSKTENPKQQQENRKATVAAFAMLVLILSLSTSSLLKNCLAPNFRKLTEARSRCDDCSVTNSAIALWNGVMISNQRQAGSHHKVLLTSGDLYFGPLIFLDPFLRMLSLVRNHNEKSLVTWIDIEVGSHSWFRHKILLQRLKNLDLHFGSSTKLFHEVFENFENTILSKSLTSNHHRIDILKLAQMMQQQKKSKSNKKEKNEASILFHLYAPELPEFTSTRQQLSRLVEFVSSGFVYNLALISSESQHVSEKLERTRKTCETMKNIYLNKTRKSNTKVDDVSKEVLQTYFEQDIWDSSIASGLTENVCRHAATSLSTSNNNHNNSSSSIPIHLAWVKQISNQCANAAKNSLVNFLHHIQSECPKYDKISEKKWNLSQVAKGFYKQLLIDLESIAVSDKKSQVAFGMMNNFEMWMKHIDLYVNQGPRKSRDERLKLISPLIGVLNQVI